MFGLSEKGFKPKDLNTIKKELEDELKQEVDFSLHFGEGSVGGMLTGIVAKQCRQVWESLNALYHSLKPDFATGQALDSLCKLTGTFRKKAAFSRAKIMVTLGPNISLPEGSRIQTIGGHYFKSTQEVKNESSEKVIKEANFVSEQTGAVIAHADTTAKIMMPMAGWSDAKIKETYEVGSLDETDEELRIRRIKALRSLGSSTLDSVRARISDINDVEDVYIKEGTHEFEAFVMGGKESDIAYTIWHCKPLGIKTAGNISYPIEDALHQERIIKFSRPQEIQLIINLELKVKKPVEKDMLKNALVNFARENFRLGTEIYPLKFYETILTFKDVLDVSSLIIHDKKTKTFPTDIKADEIATILFEDISLEQKVGIA